MYARKLLMLTVLVMVVAVLTVAGGCPRPQVDLPTPPPPPPAEAPPAAAPAATAFEWTESPQLDQIPDGPIVGRINNEDFEARSVRVRQRDDGAVLVMYDAESEKPTDPVTGATGVQLRFALDEGQPGELVVAIPDKKEFAQTHSYYHYPQEEGRGPMSVNSPWGAALQITEWTLAEDPDNPRVLGMVKGRVAICYRDQDKQSWVAGNFEAPYVR